MKTILTTVLGLLFIASVASAGPIPACSGGQEQFFIQEQPVELPLLLVCNNYQFDLGAVPARGVLMWQDSAHTILSDFIILTNTPLGSTILFTSDSLEIGLPLPDLCRITPDLCTSVNEPNPFTISAHRIGGGGPPTLDFRFVSDEEGGGASDMVGISPGGGEVPEPASLTLLGMGLVGIGTAYKRRVKRAE